MKIYEDKFTGKSKLYNAYRPPYPPLLTDYLYSEAGLTRDSVVADIGSGTGIFSSLLAAKGSTVLCVEPNNDMMKVAKSALEHLPNCSFINAPAENTGIKSGSADFVTAAQSFHWFDSSAFKAECGRILAPKGKAILLWNRIINSSSLALETHRINKMLCPEYTGASGGLKENSGIFESFFKNGVYTHAEFENNISLDEECFVGRNLSSSFAPKEGDDTYCAYTEQMKLLFNKHSRNGSLLLPMTCRVYWGEV